MKIQTKIIFLIFTIIAAFIITQVSQVMLERNRLKLFFNQFEIESSQSFDKVLKLKESTPESYVFDYTYWDELVNFVSSADKKWAQENIVASIPAYKVDAVWVYKPDFSIMYSYNVFGEEWLKASPISSGALKEIFASGPLKHFFLNSAKGLLEVWAGSIHPSSDLSRKTIPKGFFVAGRYWTKEYLNDLAFLTGSSIELSDVPWQRALTGQLKEGVISFQRIIKGWNGYSLAYLHVTIKSEGLRSFFRISLIYLLLSLIFAIIVLVSLIFFLFKWVQEPLRLISSALEKEDMSKLLSMQKSKSEFGDISRLISEFFKQKQLIEKEMIQRKTVEEELKRAHYRLESAVRERTKELEDSNEKLRQIAGELSRANIIKSEFLANVSHELRTPLNSIIGFSEVLLDQSFGQLNEKQKEYASDIYTSGRHLLGCSII